MQSAMSSPESNHLLISWRLSSIRTGDLYEAERDLIWFTCASKCQNNTREAIQKRKNIKIKIFFFFKNLNPPRVQSYSRWDSATVYCRGSLMIHSRCSDAYAAKYLFSWPLLPGSLLDKKYPAVVCFSVPVGKMFKCVFSQTNKNALKAPSVFPWLYKLQLAFTSEMTEFDLQMKTWAWFSFTLHTHLYYYLSVNLFPILETDYFLTFAVLSSSLVFA